MEIRGIEYGNDRYEHIYEGLLPLDCGFKFTWS